MLKIPAFQEINRIVSFLHFSRYLILLKEKQRHKDRKLSDKEICEKILKGLGPKCKNAWQIGITKV